MAQDNEALAIKCILLVVMLVLTAVSVVLPIGITQIRRVKESNASRRKFILSVLNCFGGEYLLPLVSTVNKCIYTRIVE